MGGIAAGPSSAEMIEKELAVSGRNHFDQPVIHELVSDESYSVKLHLAVAALSQSAIPNPTLRVVPPEMVVCGDFREESSKIERTNVFYDNIEFSHDILLCRMFEIRPVAA